MEHIHARDNQERKYLKDIEKQVLYLAARSRGWADRETHEMFARNFKIEPLFEASELALVWDGDRLLGTAGCVNDWYLGDKKIVHMCALGLLPEAQKKGLLRGLMAVMLDLVLSNARAQRAAEAGQVYMTAITQSPYLIGYFSALFEVWPNETENIPHDVSEVADAVVERFDPEVRFVRDKMILRNECSFFYKKIPYSLNRKVNRFCDSQLNYEAGDVFVVVGKLVLDRANRYIESIMKLYPELFMLNQW